MNRFTTTLLAAALLLTLAGSAAQAQGNGGGYRVSRSYGLRMHNGSSQHNHGGLQNSGPYRPQFGQLHNSHKQCSDGHCHENHGQCSDGHCHDAECGDDCQGHGESYDEESYEADDESDE